MDQSPSSSFSFSGLLKSPHALLGLLAVVLCIILVISIHANFMFGAYGSFIFLGALVTVVLYRYFLKGPETDRAQPVVSVTHQDNRVQTQIMNVELTQEIIAILHAVQNRRPPPKPNGIIDGLASDERAIKSITPEMAKALHEQDGKFVVSDTVAKEKLEVEL